MERIDLTSISIGHESHCFINVSIWSISMTSPQYPFNQRSICICWVNTHPSFLRMNEGMRRRQVCRFLTAAWTWEDTQPFFKHSFETCLNKYRMNKRMDDVNRSSVTWIGLLTWGRWLMSEQIPYEKTYGWRKSLFGDLNRALDVRPVINGLYTRQAGMGVTGRRFPI